MVNRLIPISLVFYRYMMVCKAVQAYNMGETVLASIVFKSTICLPLFFGVASVPKLSKIRMYMICMGKEERFLFETADFYKHSTFGTAFKMPFWDPFRLAFNVLSFSFMIVVPMLYFLIYKFRKSQTKSVQG